MLPFQLHPFDPTHPQAPEIRGSLSRYGSTLSLNVSLRDSRQFILPDLNKQAQREHQLWQQTCFEIFIKNPNENDYIEINLTPSGAWNAYYFLDTRKSAADDGLCEVSAMEPAQISSGAGYEEGLFKMNALIELPNQLPFLQIVGCRLGLSAVVKGLDQQLHYMALHHPSDQPDFHHPQNFALRI
jgi:hypothetical protein